MKLELEVKATKPQMWSGAVNQSKYTRLGFLLKEKMPSSLLMGEMPSTLEDCRCGLPGWGVHTHRF